MARKLLFVALAALLLVDIYAASVPRRSRRSGSSSDSSDDSSERSRPKQRQRGRAQQKPYRRPNVQEFVNQDYNRPLYVQAPRTQDYNRPLYVQAPETQDYNRPLYVQAPETQDYNRPLYVQAPETQDYNRPLYVQAPETQDYNRPQYVQAPKTQDNNRPQYVQAQEYNGAEENIALQRGNRSKRSLSLETEAGLNVELNRSGKNRNNGVATGGSARSSLKVDQEIELLDIMKLLEMEIAMDAAKDASKKNNGNSRHSGVTVNTGHSNSNRMSLPSHSTKTSETHKSRAQIQDIKVGDYSSNSERKRDNKGREISSSKDLEVSKKAHVDGLDIEVDAQIAENVNNKHGSRRGHQVETSRVGDYSSNSERKRDNKGREITSSKDLEVSKKAHVDGLDIEVDDQVTETVGKHGSRPEHQVETSRIVSTHESISNNDRNDNRNGNRNRGVGFQIGNMAVSADLNRGLYGQVRNGVRERVDGGNTLRTRLADRTGNAMQSGIDATLRGVNRVTEHAKNGANFGVTLAQNSADRGRQSGDRSLNRLNAATTYARNMLDGMSRMAQNGIETRNNLRNRVRDSMTRGVQRGATLQTNGINALNTMATNGARTTSRLVDNAVGAMRSTTSLLRNPISALSATREAMRMSGDANINGPLGSFSFSYGQ